MPLRGEYIGRARKGNQNHAGSAAPGDSLRAAGQVAEL